MDNDKEFLEYILKLGKIKDVEEAFKDFPPENEWHGGKISNVVREDKEEYSKFNAWDIVFIKNYKYKEKEKNRVFVIILQNNLAVPIENFCKLISSKIIRDTTFKPDVIYKITDKQILFKIGEVSIEKIKEYRELYKKLN